LTTEFIKVQFRACESIRIMGFQSRELYIAFAKTAVTWTCNINHSPAQTALERRSENSLARGRLSELSVDKYHPLVS
jgi:hypothetical protein